MKSILLLKNIFQKLLISFIMISIPIIAYFLLMHLSTIFYMHEFKANQNDAATGGFFTSIILIGIGYLTCLFKFDSLFFGIDTMYEYSKEESKEEYTKYIEKKEIKKDEYLRPSGL